MFDDDGVYHLVSYRTNAHAINSMLCVEMRNKQTKFKNYQISGTSVQNNIHYIDVVVDIHNHAI